MAKVLSHPQRTAVEQYQGYGSVFTPDVEIDSNGTIEKGQAAIRKVVTGLLARQAANRADGKRLIRSRKLVVFTD